MVSKYISFFVIFIFYITTHTTNAEMTVEELIFDDAAPFHLKILNAIPEEGIIKIGSTNPKNTIIEFMDYFCGYCKKLQPELEELVSERDDLQVVFIQYPILNESSFVISKMVIAANFQGKGLELHNAIFSSEGSLTKEKLQQALINSGVDEIKLKQDMEKDETEKILHLSTFLAGGVGARGTPALFVNENFSPGYIPKNRIINFLK